MSGRVADSSASAPIWGAAFLVAGLALALWLYRPWTDLPFDVWDYREFLPILQSHDGAGSQVEALGAYYATHGRANLLFYATFVVQWQAFGMDPLGWQWWRFASMVVVLVLMYGLLRRLRFTPWAAAAGTATLLASTGVQRGWVQLMAEPQALALLLGATLLATRFQAGDRWLARAGGIAVLLLAALLSKEVVGVLALPVTLVALIDWDRGGLARPLASRRNLALAGMLLAVAIGVGVALLQVRQAPDATGYGMAYGSASLSLGALADRFGRTILPHLVGESLALGLVYPANVAFLVLVGLGWYRRLREPADGAARTGRMMGGALVLLVPLCGAVAYWPWPKWDSFYGLPFLAGSAFLVAGAVEALTRHERTGRWLAAVAVLVMVAYSAVAADRSLRAARAMLLLHRDVAMAIAGVGPGERVAVAGPVSGPGALPVRAFEFKDYAVAVGLSREENLPLVLEADCPSLPGLLAGGAGPLVVVSFAHGCGLLQGARVSLRRAFAYRDWLSFGRREGMVGADLAWVVPVPLR